MFAKQDRASRQILVCITLAITAAWALAACGGEEDGEARQAAQTLSFVLEGKGSTSTKIALSKETADPGIATIRLVNNSTEQGELQLIRVEGDHSPEEASEGLSKAIEGRAVPEWFFAAGGVGPVPSGESATVKQVLRPGTYYAYDTTVLFIDPLTGVVVEGEESDEELKADVTITAVDNEYEIDELPAGPAKVAFENVGAQPHNVQIAPLLGESTAEDAKRFFRNQGPEAPFNADDIRSTPVIEAGESQLIDLDLEPGRYVFFCTVSDREGGNYHSLNGMVDEVEIE